MKVLLPTKQEIQKYVEQHKLEISKIPLSLIFLDSRVNFGNINLLVTQLGVQPLADQITEKGYGSSLFFELKKTDGLSML